MSFGGSEAPCAHGSLTSIGGLGPPWVATISKTVAAILQAKLGVPPERFYLAFTDIAACNMARAFASYLAVNASNSLTRARSHAGLEQRYILTAAAGAHARASRMSPVSTCAAVLAIAAAALHRPSRRRF
jgi:hypothetical protein